MKNSALDVIALIKGMEKREILYGSYEVDFIDTLRAVQYIAFLKGYDISLYEAELLWLRYSVEVNAGWMGCELDNPEEVWECIKKYFPNPDEELINHLKKVCDETEYVVEVRIYKRPK